MHENVSHLSHIIVCRISSYQDIAYKIIHSSSLFISSGVDWYVYIYMDILVQLLDTTNVAFLSCMYI